MRKRNLVRAVAALTAVSMVTAMPTAAFAETLVGTQDSVYAEGTEKITVKGDVENYDGSGVNVDAWDKDADASVTVEGKISSKTEGYEILNWDHMNAVSVNAESGGKATANVKDVSIESESSVSDFDSEHGTIARYYVSGINASGVDKGTASVTVDGNIDVKMNPTAMETDKKKTQQLVYGRGVDVSADTDATVNVTVNGNINVSGSTKNAESTKVHETEIIGTGIRSSSGTDGYNTSGTVNVTVNGNITARTGISADDLGENNITVNGNINAEKYGMYVGDGTEASDKTTGVANITVKGDVKGGTYGIAVEDYYGTVNIITDGTVSGGDAAVYFANDVNVPARNEEEDYTGDTKNSKTEAPNITVWKLESSSSDLVVAETETYNYKTDSNGKLVLDEFGMPTLEDEDADGDYTTAENKSLADKIAKSINYIIKGSVTENGKATSNGKIVLSGTSGTVKIGDKTYDTAHQDEKITIKVETVSGYRYKLKNGEALLKANKDGTYTLMVPAGGGVELNAVLEKITSNKSSGSSGGSGGGSGTGLGAYNTVKITSGSGSTVKGIWTQGTDGRWMFTANNHSYKDEWAYAVNSYAKNSQSTADWFRFDANGNMLTGWYKNAQGDSYYLNPVSDNTLGRMLKGWQYIDGAWYFFETANADRLGALYKSSKTPDGSTVDASGKLVVNGAVVTDKAAKSAGV